MRNNTTVSSEGNYSALRREKANETRTQGNEHDNDADDDELRRAKSPTMDNGLIIIPLFCCAE